MFPGFADATVELKTMTHKHHWLNALTHGPKLPAQSSDVPRSTGPQPRIPAATAPCSDPGSAARVIRAATFVGVMPCSAIATSSRSRK